jgi:N6-adenosine-specific RNA methylase IME4
MEQFPTNKQYGVIYADVPWPFRTYSAKGEGRSAKQHYETMTIDAIKALPVQAIAAPNCALLMWVNGPLLPECLDIIQGWGFRHKGIAFAWCRQNTKSAGFAMGCGYYTRANVEVCFLATRGSPKRVDRGVRSLIVAPRREHSRKPDQVRAGIERLFGDVPRIELFARQSTPGWDTFGNQTTLFDQVEEASPQMSAIAAPPVTDQLDLVEFIDNMKG